MKLALAFLIFIAVANNAVTANENSWINNLVIQLQQLKPYQVTAFRNSSLNPTSEIDDVLQQIMSALPTIVIDFSSVWFKSNNSFVKVPSFSYPKKTTVFIMLLTQGNYSEIVQLQQIQFMFDFFIRLSPRTTRPRCLLLYLNANLIPGNWLQKILYYAWSKKFLDFTILAIPSRNDNGMSVDMFNYNPYTMIYDYEPYSLQTDIFPDKVVDMHGYALKIPYIDMPPFMSIEEVSEKNFSYVGSGIGILRSFSRTLNFSINIINTKEMRNANSSMNAVDHSTEDNLGMTIHYAVQSLRDNKFDMLPVPLYPTNTDINSENVEKTRSYVFDKFVVVASVSAMVEINTSLETFLYLLVNMCFIIIFIVVAHCLRLTKKIFSCFPLISLSLGQWVKPPHKSSERTLFFCIVFLSFTYSSNIYAKVTESNVKSYELPLSTAEDIEKSKLIPQINEGLHILYFKEKATEESYEKLKEKLAVVDRAQTCLKSLLRNKKFLCFTTQSMAAWFTKINEQPDGCPLLRYSDFEFLSVRSALYFSNGSPYVEKFDRLIQRFVEFGFFELWERDQMYKSICSEDRRTIFNNYNHNHLMKQLLLVLANGYILSAVVFLFEIIYKLLKNKVVFNCFKNKIFR